MALVVHALQVMQAETHQYPFQLGEAEQVVGLFCGAGIFLITLERLFRVLSGRITDDEVAAFAGEHQGVEKLVERA